MRSYKNCFIEDIPIQDDEVFSLSLGQLRLESDDDSSVITAGGESEKASVDVNDSSQETSDQSDQSDRWGDTLVFTLDNNTRGWFTNNTPKLNTSYS